MALIIETATPRDYDAIAALINHVRGDGQLSARDLEARDTERDPMLAAGYLLATLDGHPVGFASYTQHLDLYHPRKFWVSVMVAPQSRRRKAGTRLYDALLDALRPRDPLALHVQINEDNSGGLAFAARCGFAVYHKRWTSTLRLHGTDVAAELAALEFRLGAEGIALKTVAELSGDPQRDARLHALQWALEGDVPMADAVTPLTAAQFQRAFVAHPHFVQDGTFIALDGSAYVGLSFFFADDDMLDIDLTGVLPAYRRRGIARALKLKGIAWAQANGYRAIRVTNDDQNAAILALNASLGFVRGAATLQLVATRFPWS